MANRDDLIQAVQDQLAAAGVESSTKKDVGVAVDAVLRGVRKVAMTEGSIRTVIGTFKRKDQAARMARNPRTGESVEVAAKQTLALKAYAAGEEAAAEQAEAAPAKKAPVAAKKAAPAPVKKVAAAPAKKVVVAKKK
jgi:DNA-binding protein HU-beta